MVEGRCVPYMSIDDLQNNLSHLLHDMEEDLPTEDLPMDKPLSDEDFAALWGNAYECCSMLKSLSEHIDTMREQFESMQEQFDTLLEETKNVDN